MAGRSRLTELGRSSIVSGIDEEAARSANLLAEFTREATQIDKVLNWARTQLKDAAGKVYSASSSETELQPIEKQLDGVEEKLKAVRNRLTRMTSDNSKFVREHQRSAPATVQARLVQYRKMGQDFLKRVDELSQVRADLRNIRQDALQDEVLRVNPDADVKALAAGRLDIEQAIGDVPESVAASRQLDFIRQRNQKIVNMAKSLQELHTLFQDMSVLINSQQDLINKIEYEVQETHQVAVKAVEELETAHEYQKKANRKRRMIIMISLIIILIIAAGIGIWLYFWIRNQRYKDRIINLR